MFSSSLGVAVDIRLERGLAQLPKEVGQVAAP